MLNRLHILSRNHCSTTDDCSIGDFFLAQGRLFPWTQRIVALCRMAPLVHDDSAWGRAATDSYRSALYQYNHNLRVSLLDKRRPEAYDPITFVIRKSPPFPPPPPAPCELHCDSACTSFTMWCGCNPVYNPRHHHHPAPHHYYHHHHHQLLSDFFQEGDGCVGGIFQLCVPG